MTTTTIRGASEIIGTASVVLAALVFVAPYVAAVSFLTWLYL